MKVSSRRWQVAALALAAMDCGRNPGSGPGNGTVTVNGTVLNSDATPAAGASIWVLGTGQSTDAGITLQASDSNGHFVASNIAAPFTLYVRPSGQNSVTAYAGLTRTDPTVVLQTSTGNPTVFSATLSGHVTGGSGYPAGVNDVTRVLFAADGGFSGAATASNTSGNYSINANWTAPLNPLSVTEYALEFTCASFPFCTSIAAYQGYGTASGISLSNGGTTGQNLSLSSVSTTTLNVGTNLPAGYTAGLLALQVNFPLGANLDLLFSNSASLSGLVPVIPNATFTATALTGNAAGESSLAVQSGIAADAGSVALSPPAAAQLSAPNNSTTLSGLPTFRWSQTSGVHEVVINEPGGATQSFFLFTADSSFTLPDLAPLGMHFESSAGYTWSVSSFAPVASMDAAATATFVGSSTGTTTGSVAFNFTSAP